MTLKKISQFIFRRVVIVALLLVIQVGVMAFFFFRFSHYSAAFYAFSVFCSLVAVFAIVSGRANPAYKIAWIILIMALPIFGGPFYLLFGFNKLSRHSRKKMAKIAEDMKAYNQSQSPVLEDMARRQPDAGLQARYIENDAYCPPYRHTFCEYHPNGEFHWKRLLEELEKAEHYIFLEYFIIEEGAMWDPILAILRRKASEGVDVRVIYDDLGSIFKLPDGYDQLLESYGIRACVFNPFIPVLNLRMNNRDHR